MALGTAGFYGIVYSNEPIQETVNYNTGDFNQIAGAKLRADAYERRTPTELNYSTNIRALEMGPQGGEDEEDGNINDLGWPDSIPSYENNLKPEYMDAVADHLRTQNHVIWCSTPSIKNVTTYDSDYSKFEANIEDAWIKCRSGLKDGSRPTIATVNLSDNLQTHHPNNRYLELADFGLKVGKDAQQIANQRLPGPLPTEGSATTSCQNSDKEATKERAKSNARSNGLSQIDTEIAGDAWAQNQEEAQSREFTAEYGTNFPNRDIDFNSIPPNPESSECTYKVQVGTDKNGNPIYDKRKSKEYTYTYEYDPTHIDISFNLVDDSGREVIDSKGEYNKITFSFTYEHGV